MPRIELSPAHVQGVLVREYVFPRPIFGPGCVCCQRDARDRTETIVPRTSGSKIVAPAVPVPVCTACRGHAFLPELRMVLVAGMLLAAIIAITAGAITSTWPAIAAGVPLVGVVVAIAVVDHRRVRALRGGGHHPQMMLMILRQTLYLVSTSDALLDDVLARNPMARRPLAGTSAKTDAAADRDAEAELVAQKIVSGKPADLDQVRILLAAGTVSHVLVEGHLGEVEQTLGRRDLRARYRALREEAPAR